MIPPLASRFVAGETAASATDHVRDLHDRDLGAILNHLGEHYDDERDAAADAAAYRDLVDDLAALDATRACISVKPTQLGLAIGEDTFREHLDPLVDHAASRDVFVWLDMERHPTIDATLDAYEALATEHDGGVGVCVQSNMRRTADDLERLAALPGKVRLVKGAYDPPRDVAYPDRQQVNRAYRDDLEFMLAHFDDGVAVGSHDPAMIDHAKQLAESHDTPFEFQLLMGVRVDAQERLAAEGYDVYQYVPYGGKWLSYFYRRIVERKENALFALRAILG